MLVDLSLGSRSGDLGCKTCGLYQHCRNPRMGPTGRGGRGVLIIAEAPGADEDALGEQLVGKAGQFLQNVLYDIGVDLDRDCWKLNAVNCRPPKNRTPTDIEINSCREEIVRGAIESLKPSRIIVLGKTALDSILDGRIEKPGPFIGWAGLCIPDQQWGCLVFPTWHPSYLMRMQNDDLTNHFTRHLRRAFESNDEFVPDPAPNRFDVLRGEDAARLFSRLRRTVDWFAFDYETTALSPATPGAEVLCVAVAWPKKDDGIESVVVPFDDESAVRAFRRLLEEPGIRKVAHNIGFESEWSVAALGVHPESLYDTMIAAHVEHNRSASGLKVQIYQHFGVAGYDASVVPLIKAGPNGLNRLRSRMDDVLQYCAADAYYTGRLYIEQLSKFSRGMSRGNALLQAGSAVLVRATNRGLRVDVDYLRSTSARLERRLSRLSQELASADETQKLLFESGVRLSPTSTETIAALLTKVLGVHSLERTPTGRPRVTDSDLDRFADRFPIIETIRKYRELQKIKSTYIDGVLNVTTDGRIHPRFHLDRVATYRSSSSEPNFQNFPKRNQRTMRMIRRAITPSPGRLLLAADYGGIEVRISACVHKDPSMIRYVSDPETDMHRDVAMELFMLDAHLVTKELRHTAKNGFVFPSFYGSYFKQTAPRMWEMIESMSVDGVPVREHLRCEGICDGADWEEHVRAVEHRFWNDRFAVFNRWKDKTWELYLERGYVTLKTGFVCRGPMSRNEVVNYQIQGPAFHCLLWSLVRVDELLRSNHMDTVIVGQIHDEMVLDVVPDEFDDVVALVRQVMLVDLPNTFKWVIVPLEVEIERSAVDGNWSEMEVIE